MNNYTDTEKSLKRWLKSRVKVTVAMVVGFLITGAIGFAANVNQEQGVYDNNEIIIKVKSTKFIKGKDGNLELYTNGSTGTLLQNLKDHHGSIRDIIGQLGVQDDKNLVVVGALAGEGKYSEGVKKLQDFGKAGNKLLQNPKLDKILGILDRTNTTSDEIIQGDIKTTIGNEKTSPLVLGLIGGDMTVGVGKIESDMSELLIENKGGIINSSKDKEDLKITREGNTVSTINNGNVFGGSVGSTALSLENIATKGKKKVTKDISLIGKIKITATLNYDLKLNGNTTATINGNTSLNINGPANAAGITAGGLAAAIGGSSTSNVIGNSNININSKVNSGKLEGLTVGIFGGGMSASTLGGTANTTTSGETNINITNGLNVGLAGSGLAVSTDVSQYLVDGFKGGKIENGNFIIDPNGLPPITVSALKEGGTSNVTSGNTNIALKGTTSAAGVIGSGIAISHQNSEEGKVSSSVVKANNTNIDINVIKVMNGEGLVGNKVFSSFKNLASNLKNIVDPHQGTDVGKLIKSMKEAAGSVQDKGMVVGVLGNGIAIARDKASAKVEAQDTILNLKSGYIVGVAGNGISSGNATAEVKANSSTINVDGAEVIGLTGSGIALNHRVIAGEQSSVANIAETTVNVNSGSVDGIFGGGIAITKDDTNSKAKVTTSGKSTININGGEVDKFGFQHIKEIIGTHGSYDKITEVGKDVAISAGGVTSRNGVTSVKESEININNGTIKGNILAGGIAVSGGISTVDKSVINITGGKIEGDVIGTGIAIKEDNKVGKIDKEKTKATVGESILNIDGYNGKINKISDFNVINIGSNKSAREQSSKLTNLTITDQIDVGSGKLSNIGTINFENAEKGKALIKVTDGSVENKGIISIKYGDKVSENVDNKGTVKNKGKIQISDKTIKDLKDLDEKFAISNLFKGDYTHIGMLVDKEGNAILLDKENIASGKLTADDIKSAETYNGDKAITLSSAKIIADGKIDNLQVINVAGSVEDDANIAIENSILNVDKTGKIIVKNSKNLALIKAELNGSDSADIELSDDAKLILDSSNVKHAVIDSEKSAVTYRIADTGLKGNVEFRGNNTFDGTINVKNIAVTNGSNVAISEVSKGKGNIDLNGNIDLAVGKDKNSLGEYTKNFFANSDGNLDVTGNGSITVGTGNFTGNDVVVNLGENNKFADTLLSKLDTTNVYMIKENESLSDGKLELTYNTKLYDDPTLNNINNKAHIVNDKFSENPEERKVQLDKIYTENIYTETVRAAYDTLKSTEKTILSFEPELKTGEFKAEGKGLYSKNKYTKDGITNSYDVEVETSGLLASLEYGVTDTMTTGIVFAGSKQDVDTDGGSADADIFYLGAYGTKAYRNYNFTAGLGYQFGKYEADNNIGNIATSDKYDSKALSGYVQGKYVAKFEEGLSIQPKVKLGYTYLKQDDTKDNYFGVSDAKVKTFDTEVGVDVVKTVQLEKSKLDVTFGTSYVRTMGDTDKMFKGHFYGNNTSNSFGVLGAELAENVVKFNLGAEVASENGFFYNGGLTYEFGGNDTKAYGVNLGVGYKF